MTVVNNERNKPKKIIPKKVSMRRRDPLERARDFQEVACGLSAEEAMQEASRCLECKVPLCRDGCPVQVNIPGFISLVRDGQFAAAADKIREDNLLPSICGRVCPQESQCEKYCILGRKHDPVAIGRLERFVGDYDLSCGKKIEKPKNYQNKRVAVVGSGPGGLTCAADLARYGYDVTLFEALHTPGGVLVYGIPEFRLPKDIVNEEITALRQMGVKIECNVIIGRTITVEELLEEEGFQAVYIGTGAGSPLFPNIPGQNLPGVQSANGFLTRVNLMRAYRFPEYDTPVRIGQKIVVLGGGNVAMDAARTALRLGAEDVCVMYRRSREELPAREEEVHHAEEEGVKFTFLTAPTECVVGDDGRVKEITCQRFELGDPDPSGRRRPIPIPDSHFTMEVDNVIVAIGQDANVIIQETTPDIDLSKKGMVMVDPETGATTKRGVFAGGDIVTGAATVIMAMGAGRIAAKAIDDYLQCKRDPWKTMQSSLVKS